MTTLGSPSIDELFASFPGDAIRNPQNPTKTDLKYVRTWYYTLNRDDPVNGEGTTTKKGRQRTLRQVVYNYATLIYRLLAPGSPAAYPDGKWYTVILEFLMDELRRHSPETENMSPELRLAEFPVIPGSGLLNKADRTWFVGGENPLYLSSTTSCNTIANEIAGVGINVGNSFVIFIDLQPPVHVTYRGEPRIAVFSKAVRPEDNFIIYRSKDGNWLSGSVVPNVNMDDLNSRAVVIQTCSPTNATSLTGIQPLPRPRGTIAPVPAPLPVAPKLPVRNEFADELEKYTHQEGRDIGLLIGPIMDAMGTPDGKRLVRHRIYNNLTDEFLWHGAVINRRTVRVDLTPLVLNFYLNNGQHISLPFRKPNVQWADPIFLFTTMKEYKLTNPDYKRGNSPSLGGPVLMYPEETTELYVVVHVMFSNEYNRKTTGLKSDMVGGKGAYYAARVEVVDVGGGVKGLRVSNRPATYWFKHSTKATRTVMNAIRLDRAAPTKFRTGNPTAPSILFLAFVMGDPVVAPDDVVPMDEDNASESSESLPLSTPTFATSMDEDEPSLQQAQEIPIWTESQDVEVLVTRTASGGTAFEDDQRTLRFRALINEDTTLRQVMVYLKQNRKFNDGRDYFFYGPGSTIALGWATRLFELLPRDSRVVYLIARHPQDSEYAVVPSSPRSDYGDMIESQIRALRNDPNLRPDDFYTHLIREHGNGYESDQDWAIEEYADGRSGIRPIGHIASYTSPSTGTVVSTLPPQELHDQFCQSRQRYTSSVHLF